jgi:hypothetical protein
VRILQSVRKPGYAATNRRMSDEDRRPVSTSKVKRGAGCNLNNVERLQVLTAAIMKIRAFWDVAPCSLVGVERRFRGAYCLHHQGDECPNDGGSTHL